MTTTIELDNLIIGCEAKLDKEWNDDKEKTIRRYLGILSIEQKQEIDLELLDTLFKKNMKEIAEDDSEDDSEDDDFDYEDSCDCCVKGWSKANEFGRCVCRCDCGKLQRDCRYKCSN